MISSSAVARCKASPGLMDPGPGTCKGQPQPSGLCICASRSQRDCFCPPLPSPRPVPAAEKRAKSFLQQQQADYKSGGQGGMWKRKKK